MDRDSPYKKDEEKARATVSEWGLLHHHYFLKISYTKKKHLKPGGNST